MLRYVEGRCPEDYTSTIGIDFKKKIVQLAGNKNIKLQLWDTAGRGGYGDVPFLLLFTQVRRGSEECAAHTTVALMPLCLCMMSPTSTLLRTSASG